MDVFTCLQSAVLVLESVVNQTKLRVYLELHPAASSMVVDFEMVGLKVSEISSLLEIINFNFSITLLGHHSLVTDAFVCEVINLKIFDLWIVGDSSGFGLGQNLTRHV